MKKNLCRKGICGWLSLSMVLTGMSGSALALHAEEVQAEETASVTADIYPKPQNETYLSDEGMSLSGEVNIVVHGDQEEANSEASGNAGRQWLYVCPGRLRCLKVEYYHLLVKRAL